MNITALLRDKEISQYSSMIATSTNVRMALAALQHAIADNHDLVAEGRDMGSLFSRKRMLNFT